MLPPRDVSTPARSGLEPPVTAANSDQSESDTTPHRQRGKVKGTAGKFVTFIGASWARTLSGLIIGFVMAPLLLGTFGIVLYGLYLLIILTTAALIRPIRMALDQLYVKSMTAATADSDDHRIAQIFSNVAVVAWLVAGAFIIVGVLISLMAPAVLEFPGHHEIHVRAAIMLEAIAVALLIIRLPSVSLYLVEHNPIAFNLDLMLVRWSDLIALGLSFIPFGGDQFLTFLVIRVLLIAGLCVTRIVLARRMLPAARVRLGLVDRRVMRDLARTGALTTAQPFSSIAFEVIDNYLINIVFGPVFNALYAVVNSLRSYAKRFGADASIGGEALSADMHERGAHETLVRSLLASMRLVSGIMIICSGVVAIFFGPIIDVWLGPVMSKDEELLKIMTYREAVDLAWVFVLLLLVGGVLMEVSIAGSRFLYGMGMIGRYSGLLFAAGVSKILLGVSLVVFLLSPWEVAWLPDKRAAEVMLLFPVITLLTQIVFFGVLFPRRTLKLAEIPVWRYLKEVWCRPIGAALLPLGVGAVFILFIESWTILNLALTLVGVGLLFLPMIGWVLLTRDERQHLFRIGRGVLARVGLRAASP